MSTTCASSLALLPALNPKALSFHNKPTISFSLPPTSKPLSLTRLVGGSFPLSSRFSRNVAFAAEYGQDEEFPSFGDGKDDRSRVSPDLKVFVGNLPFSVDSSQLAELFQEAGTVEMVEVIYDKVTGRSRGFGFVTMSSAEEAEAAARQFDGYEFEGRALRVNAGPPPERDSSRPPRGSSFGGGGSFGGRSNEPVSSGSRCYVGNLSWGVDNTALESLFSEQGDVKEARVVYDRETGRSRGFGFVAYGSAEEANSAVDALDGIELDGRSIRVSIAEARPPRRQF